MDEHHAGDDPCARVAGLVDAGQPRAGLGGRDPRDPLGRGHADAGTDAHVPGAGAVRVDVLRVRGLLLHDGDVVHPLDLKHQRVQRGDDVRDDVAARAGGDHVHALGAVPVPPHPAPPGPAGCLAVRDREDSGGRGGQGDLLGCPHVRQLLPP
eukprot:746251-Hanusia_phi.AAC.1